MSQTQIIPSGRTRQFFLALNKRKLKKQKQKKNSEMKLGGTLQGAGSQIVLLTGLLCSEWCERTVCLNCWCSPSSTAILLGDPQPLPHVQSLWIHLDPTERALPHPLPTRAVRPCLSHQPASLPLQPGARGEVCAHPVLQLQPVWPTHEPGHMELGLQPQLQLAALQRLGLLRRCLIR